jgi:hypothetical protein
MYAFVTVVSRSACNTVFGELARWHVTRFGVLAHHPELCYCMKEGMELAWIFMNFSFWHIATSSFPRDKEQDR